MASGDERTADKAKDAEIRSLREEVLRLRERLVLKDNRITWIQEIGTAIGRCSSQDELMTVIMERITRIMDAERATIFLLEEDGRSLWSRFVSNQDVQEIRVDVGEGIAGWVALHGKSVNVKNAYADPRFNPDVDRQLGTTTGSVLCQPMREKRGELIGVVQVLNKREGYFSMEDEALLSALANTASVVLDNHRLYLDAVYQSLEAEEARRRLEERVHELDVLYHLQRQLLGSEDLESVLPLIADHVLSIVDAGGALLVLREGGGLLCHARTVGGDVSDVWREPSTSAPLLLQWMEERQETRLCNTMACLPPDALLKRVTPTIRNVAVAPLLLKGEVQGAIALVNRSRVDGGEREAGFDGADRKLLALIAGQCSAAIARSIHRQQEIEEDRLGTIGRMMSGVLHDLRSPLAAVSGYVQLMARSPEEERRQEYARRVKRQFTILDQMIRDVLAYARGDASVLRRKVSLRDFVRDIEEMLHHEFDGTAVELRVDGELSGDGWFDELKIRRVLFNLARNAREAMRGEGTYGVTLRREADDLLIRCADNGPGIDDFLRERIFEAFVSSGNAGNTGLGLAIVKRFVEDHGGNVHFESDLGRGTVFEVRVPIGNPGVERDDAAAPVRALTGTPALVRGG